MLIGAVTGALPPLIGYTAAGGPIIDTCLVFSLFMFLWQVSHFELLLLKYGKEYESAGFPAMTFTADGRRERISVFIWIAATVASALALLTFRIVSGSGFSGALIAGSVLFLFIFSMLVMRAKQRLPFGMLSASLHAYQGFVFFLIIGSEVLNPS